MVNLDAYRGQAGSRMSQRTRLGAGMNKRAHTAFKGSSSDLVSANPWLAGKWAQWCQIGSCFKQSRKPSSLLDGQDTILKRCLKFSSPTRLYFILLQCHRGPGVNVSHAASRTRSFTVMGNTRVLPNSLWGLQVRSEMPLLLHCTDTWDMRDELCT